jgi:hypothetical protein
MVLVLVLKLSRKVKVGKHGVSEKNKINAFVTTSHILVTLAFSISQGIVYLGLTVVEETRMNSAFTFFGGLADMFLSIMLWFILDSKKSPALLVDGDKVYAVTEVVNPRHSGEIN